MKVRLPWPERPAEGIPSTASPAQSFPGLKEGRFTARSAQIVEIKPGQVLAGNDLGMKCDFVPPGGRLNTSADFAGKRQTYLLPTSTPLRASLAGAPEVVTPGAGP